LPRLRTSGWVLLGVLLLAVSVLGANKGLQSSGDSASEPANTTELNAGGFGHVDVDGGVTNVYTSQLGDVVEVLAKEGDDVGKGAPLFRVDDKGARLDLDRANKAVEDAELLIEGAKNKVIQHAAALDAQKKAIIGEQAKLKAVQFQVNEAERLYNGEQIGKEKVDMAKAARDAQQAKVELEQDRERAMQAEDPTVEVRRAENDREDKKKLVEKAQYAVDKCTVKAPAKGKVLRVFVTVGETLGPSPRQPAVQFAAAGDGGKLKLIVRAEIDQEFSARVLPSQEKQKAEIQDDVRRSGTWTGTVRRVSDWYTHRRSILMEPGQMNDVRTLEVIIDLDNPPPDLKIGQRVRVMLK
jgi:multidrug efflux pump subunit AcrA (membrane-fusion protein)